MIAAGSQNFKAHETLESLERKEEKEVNRRTNFTFYCSYFVSRLGRDDEFDEIFFLSNYNAAILSRQM